MKNKNFMAMEKLASESGSKDLARLKSFPSRFASLILEYLPNSKSQLRQDIFALVQSDFKHGGYFVEFGATNGKDRSNSYLLEKDFGWTGILAEPAKLWHDELELNRSCVISHNCVWVKSGSEIEFTECDYAELSTITSFADKDIHAEKRQLSQKYKVTSISLIDLLERNNAPKVIDFLSIDTEGSEFEILKAFDFSKYKFNSIVCEHNYGSTREQVFQLLVSKGYTRVYEDISDFDDWYILRTE